MPRTYTPRGLLNKHEKAELNRRRAREGMRRLRARRKAEELYAPKA